MRTISFSKGHGTRNDFVIVEDRSNFTPLDADDVRFLCDRRGGIGADGVLRVTRAGHIAEWDGDPDLWFMDYRNADGSIAEMCGNGLRVFGRYLYDTGLTAREPVWVGTRAGLRRIEPTHDGRFTITMGTVGVGRAGSVTIHTPSGDFRATPADVGNPHAVVLLGDDVDLAALDLREAPTWSPAEAFPDGVNVEFVSSVSATGVPLDARHVRMRVFERGSGETQSCGTGTVAAAAVHAAVSGLGDGTTVVDVPGGRIEVELFDDGTATLIGPAEIVATGRVHLP